MAIANLYRFASKETHLPSGTYYFGQRFYDPNLQRFLNQDPLQEAGGLNLFSFVHNSPLNRLDPWGLDDAMDELNRLIPGDHVPRARDLYALDPDVQDNLNAMLGPFIDPTPENLCRAAIQLYEFFDPIRQLREGLHLLPLLSLLAGQPWLAAGFSLLDAAIYASEGDVTGTVLASLGALPVAGLIDDAARGARQTYEILDGVRRAKAASTLGKETIKAEVIGANGVSQGVRQLPVESLRSPKSVIELQGAGAVRWERVLEGTRSGANLPPILVTPGGTGIPIIDVILGYY